MGKIRLAILALSCGLSFAGLRLKLFSAYPLGSPKFGESLCEIYHFSHTPCLLLPVRATAIGEQGGDHNRFE